MQYITSVNVSKSTGCVMASTNGTPFRNPCLYDT